MLYSVRVRGIYATALSVLLHEKGFLIADPSRVLESRLSLPPVRRAPEVTVKSLSDDLDSVLVIGYPWEAGERVYSTLAEAIPYTVARRGLLGLYTVVDAVSLGNCDARTVDGVVVRLSSNECPPPGEALRGTIVKEALEAGARPVLSPSIRVVGPHLIVSHPGSGVSFSEHIRGEEERARLLAAIMGKGLESSHHIHFRSGARLASDYEIAEEAEKLAGEAEKLWSEGPSGGEAIIRRGEFIGIVGFTSASKRVLDSYRSRITETIDRHHSLKSTGEPASTLVDCGEEQLRSGGSLSGAGIEYYLAKRREGRSILLLHKKPDGSTARLGPYKLSSATRREDRIVLVAEKTLKSHGILDGLNVEKRPGDRAVSRIDTGEWHIIHEYYDRSGRLLGVYGNINSPPEIGDGIVKYFDLYIDVVKRPGEAPEIIDRDQLDTALEQGIVSKDLYERALEEAERLSRILASAYP